MFKKRLVTDSQDGQEYERLLLEKWIYSLLTGPLMDLLKGRAFETW